MTITPVRCIDITALELGLLYESIIAPQQPVLIKNFLTDDALISWVTSQKSTIKPLYTRGAVPFLYTYFEHNEISQRLFNLPIFKQLANDRRIKFRQQMRLWQHQQGNISALHYDQRSTDLFNLCLTGKKQWLFAPPSAPVKCWPFYNIALPWQTQRNLPWQTATMEAGDLLFIPRNWFHQVTTLANNTQNINLIFNRLDNGDMQAREAELAALRATFIPHYVYGDNNPAINQTIQHVSFFRRIKRLLKELTPVIALMTALTYTVW
jgi:hypothetical protein